MYFDHCQTLNDLKGAYKKLALKHHPDCGGDVRIMQDINAEYDRIFEVLKRQDNAQAKEEGQEWKVSTEESNEFKEIIEALIKISGIIIELCGSWLWISGNTYENKDALKAAGCAYSGSKKMWYWHHAEDSDYRSRGNTPIEDIRAKYGSELISDDSKEKLVAVC